MKNHFGLNQEELRTRIYRSYDSLLNTGKQIPVGSPKFLDTGKVIFLRGNIQLQSPVFIGKTYLSGEVLSRERIGSGFIGYVISANQITGIETFENYTRIGFRPAIAASEARGLVINRAALERAFEQDPAKLKGHTVEDVIGLNFAQFPAVMQKMQEMSEGNFAEFYIELWKRHPLFF